MARPLRIQYPGAFYHVTCRGNERRKIFRDDDDRYQFLTLLSESLALYQVKLYGYVLMDNHFHLVVQTRRANLSEFMRRFNICYTGWFNYHHHTCGHLYQGRYKAIVVDADTYLVELSRYIHLNPVRVGSVQKLEYRAQWQYLRQYRWSSLPGYVNESQGIDYVTYDFVLAMMGGRRAYQRFVRDGLRAGVENLFEDVQYQTILGDEAFVARVKREYIEDGSLREQPMYRDLVCKKIEPEIVLQSVIEVMGVARGEFGRRERGGVVRGIAAEMLYKFSGLTQMQIGQLLGGIDYSAVYQLRRRMKERFVQDKVLRLRFSEIERKIKKMLNVEI
jgi:putative transposase